MMDLHTHSEFSLDCKTPTEENIKKAIELGIKYISVTEHLDITQPEDDYRNSLDIDGYLRKVGELRDRYKENIDILYGVELSIQSNTGKAYEKIVENRGYDFIIGSAHGAEGEYFVGDGVYSKYSIEDFYKYYYEQIQKSVENTDCFNVLGHIDYMDRYFSNKEEIPPIENYFEYIKPTLKSLIERGKGIEINTASLRQGLDYYHPKRQVLQLYKSLGGEIITLGSDAHLVEEIGFNILNAIRMLKEEGFNKAHIFKERKPVEIIL